MKPPNHFETNDLHNEKLAEQELFDKILKHMFVDKSIVSTLSSEFPILDCNAWQVSNHCCVEEKLPCSLEVCLC